MRHLAIAIATATLLAACGGGESKAVGHWKSANEMRTTDVMSIERSGESYIVTSYAPSLFDGRIQRRERPAIYEDGVLMITTEKGNQPVLYKEGDDTIVLDGRRNYVRTNAKTVRLVSDRMEEEQAAMKKRLEDNRKAILKAAGQ